MKCHSIVGGPSGGAWVRNLRDRLGSNMRKRGHKLIPGGKIQTPTISEFIKTAKKINP